jgi:DNA replication protein DnaD
MERVETPTQTVEYGHTRVDSELFTAATLDKTLERNAHLYAQPETSAPTPTVETAAETYSLNMSAVKKAVAAFVGTVAVMLTAIGINTQIIKATELKIAAVQQRNAEVVAQIAAIEEQIAYERSEEVIADFAQANGMVKGN